jgi:hypothetical protein
LSGSKSLDIKGITVCSQLPPLLQPLQPLPFSWLLFLHGLGLKVGFIFLILYSSELLVVPFAFGLMGLAVLVDIFVCLLQGREMSELEQMFEQQCSFSPSLGEGLGCTSSLLLQVNSSVVWLSIIFYVTMWTKQSKKM